MVSGTTLPQYFVKEYYTNTTDYPIKHVQRRISKITLYILRGTAIISVLLIIKYILPLRTLRCTKVIPTFFLVVLFSAIPINQNEDDFPLSRCDYTLLPNSRDSSRDQLSDSPTTLLPIAIHHNSLERVFCPSNL